MIDFLIFEIIYLLLFKYLAQGGLGVEMGKSQKGRGGDSRWPTIYKLKPLPFPHNQANPP